MFRGQKEEILALNLAIEEPEDRKALNEAERIIAAKSGDEGKLFGSVGTRDIAEAITASGVSVDKSEVRLPNGAIRNTGEYTVTLHLHSDVNAEVSVTVVAE